MIRVVSLEFWNAAAKALTPVSVYLEHSTEILCCDQQLLDSTLMFSPVFPRLSPSAYCLGALTKNRARAARVRGELLLLVVLNHEQSNVLVVP